MLITGGVIDAVLYHLDRFCLVFRHFADYSQLIAAVNEAHQAQATAYAIVRGTPCKLTDNIDTTNYNAFLTCNISFCFSDCLLLWFAVICIYQCVLRMI